MDHITTEGPSIIEMTCRNGNKYTVSVLSVRAAMLAIYKSGMGEWKKPMVEYAFPFQVENFILIGFQPQTGFHLGFKKPSLKGESTWK